MVETCCTNILNLSKEELYTKFSDKDEINALEEIHDEKNSFDSNNLLEIKIEPITIDFTETKFIPFPEPIDSEKFEKNIYEFIKENPGIDTDSIIEYFKHMNSWNILEILDKLKLDGKIK